MKRKQPWWYAFMAGLLVTIALALGAIVWIMSGSRDQALQMLLVTLLVELVAVCVVLTLVLVAQGAGD